MTEIVTRDEAVKGLELQLKSETFTSELEEALPEKVSLVKFRRSFLMAVSQNEDLLRADRGSLFRSLLRCAMDGLLPDGREAAITVYNVQGTPTAQYLPMVGGLRKIAADFGWTIRSRVVREGDHFVYSEEPPDIDHKPGLDETAPLIAAYAVAEHRDGRRIQRVMGKVAVEKRRAIAKTKKVWDSWPAEMWEKTVVHDLYDELPLGDTEEDRERLGRMLASFENSPAEAEAGIYGTKTPPPGVDPDTGEIVEDAELVEDTPRGSSADVPEADQESREVPRDETSGGNAEQASRGEDSPVEPPAAGSSDEPPLDDDAPARGPSGFTLPEGAIEASGDFVVTSGESSKPIRDVSDAWLTWALRSLEAGEARAAAEVWARHRKPEVWAAYEAETAT